MKRFLVFFGKQYYPGGGMADFIIDCDTLDEAKRALRMKVLNYFRPKSTITAADIKELLGLQKWGNVYDTVARTEVYELEPELFSYLFQSQPVYHLA